MLYAKDCRCNYIAYSQGVEMSCPVSSLQYESPSEGDRYRHRMIVAIIDNSGAAERLRVAVQKAMRTSPRYTNNLLIREKAGAAAGVLSLRRIASANHAPRTGKVWRGLTHCSLRYSNWKACPRLMGEMSGWRAVSKWRPFFQKILFSHFDGKPWCHKLGLACLRSGNQYKEVLFTWKITFWSKVNHGLDSTQFPMME